MMAVSDSKIILSKLIIFYGLYPYENTNIKAEKIKIIADGMKLTTTNTLAFLLFTPVNHL